MRTIVIDEDTNLEGLRARLLGERPFAGTALERLKSLNPHVNFKKIPAGTVLLVPELPGLRKGETTSVTGDFDTLREDLLGALDASRARVRSGFEALQAQEKEVGTAVRSAAFRRALELDPELQGQAEAGMQAFKQDRETAKTTAEELKALRQEAMTELTALGKLLEA
jgi:hypothetical protein